MDESYSPCWRGAVRPSEAARSAMTQAIKAEMIRAMRALERLGQHRAAADIDLAICNLSFPEEREAGGIQDGRASLRTTQTLK